MVGPEGVDPDVFHRAYEGQAPWDIGAPQPEVMDLIRRGQIGSPVLDIGCGTGYNARAIARAGRVVTAIDLVPTAVELARAMDADNAVEWLVGDALDLSKHLGERQFGTVLDAGVFHVFGDKDRDRYVQSLWDATAPGGRCHVIVFSDAEGGDDGPRRVRRVELEEAFRDWKREAIVETRYGIRSRPDGARAWRGTWIKA